MERYRKKDMLQTVDTLLKANNAVAKTGLSNPQGASEALVQCQESAIVLGTYIDTLGKSYAHLVHLLEDYCENIYQMSESLSDANLCRKLSKKIQKQLTSLHNGIKYDLPQDKKEVVFLPYKASMWDSLESVWKAAEADPECDAYVIPIPYFDKNPDGSLREEHYEGDQYPGYVPVTHYDDYNLKTRRPDAIYIHNPYDECNHVTSVHPYFYARNLRNYTDKLVYIPYFILSEIEPDNQAAIDGMKHFCFTPGTIYSHQVIVQSENMRQIYINEYMKAAEEMGLSGEHVDRKFLEKKFLGTGSPKVDKVLNTRKEDLEVPEEWLKIIGKPDGSWKKIVFYNTSVSALLHNDEKMLRKMESVFGIFKENKDEVALLWRPHPLIQATIESMRPQLWEGYKEIRDRYLEEGWGIYDDTADMDRAVILSDAYYGDGSSVVELCQKVGMLVMMQNVKILSKHEHILLSTYDMAFTEKSIYFAAKNIMGFFEYNRQTEEIKQIAFDAIKMGELFFQFAFGGTCLCKDKVFFAPFMGSKALVYSNDEERMAQVIDVKQCINGKKYNHYFIKRAIALDNLIYLVGDACTDMLFINMDTMQVSILDSWKTKISGDVTFGGTNTRWDVCIVDDVLFVPLNYNNQILEINMKTQESKIHKINGEKILFSTICFDGVYFWLTGTASAVVKWNKTDDSVEVLKDFPKGFQKFVTEDYGEELFSRSFYEKGYVYLFPLTVNMVLKINTKTGQMKSLHQWNTLKSCYTVERWDVDAFYIETLNGDYNDIDESMLMDMDGNIVRRNIFTIRSDDLQYILSEKKYQFYIETSAFTLDDFIQRKL